MVIPRRPGRPLQVSRLSVQEYWFSVELDVGEEFLISKKIGSGEERLKSLTLEGSSIFFDCRTQSNTNRSIEFDWIFVRFCSIGYAGYTAP